MGDFTVIRQGVFGPPAAAARTDEPCVVAIPVRNEEGGIGRCLDALARLDRRAGNLHQVLLVLNGCTDATWEVARAWACGNALSVRMADIRLAEHANHAGGARAAALTMALQLLRGHPRGVVLTTDADTRVPHDWLERALGNLDAGCDVVAGDVDVDAAALSLWPASLRRRVHMEDTYAQLLDEVDALCDPVPHNPWPTHRRCSGANLVFRASALRLLPHIPAPSCGEDKALVAACLARDLRVRHDPGLRVETSARLHGRAQGGMADTLRWRTSRPDAPCDPLLETFTAHLRRATLRATIRHFFVKGTPDRDLASMAGLTLPGTASHACHYFGEAWQRLESQCPSLQRRSLSPRALPREIERARAWLGHHHADRQDQEVAA
ncbi:MAG TPA: glycosyltransferase family 2 protein [Luteibacter sp.]|nr:glycosyltransferase family 2 protein [Luteibacter sp.]